MISAEPRISVGIIQQASEIFGHFNGLFDTPGIHRIKGSFHVTRIGTTLFIIDEHDAIVASGPKVRFRGTNGTTFTLKDVTIGIGFHWERKEDQNFAGDLVLIADVRGITAINEVGLEAYLLSVISSEMSASSPLELLKAHAMTSRSWLAAMLERQRGQMGRSAGALKEILGEGEIVRFYGREDHELFDVCADDHCQRYQGVTKTFTKEAERGVTETRGLFLVYNGSVCDARYYKACGGRTEDFRSAWEDADIPYLRSVSDAEVDLPKVSSEDEASAFIGSSPDVWCNTKDATLLKSVLPAFDQETEDFFRWTVRYGVEELSALIRERSGFDFGTIKDLLPVARGPSGRVVRLKIVGSKKTLIIGKELEIRKWLSKSHLYSSAFVVEKNADATGGIVSFTLCGAGWGHGVGLCQIGAAVMAASGKSAEEIVRHYFVGAELRTLYS